MSLARESYACCSRKSTALTMCASLVSISLPDFSFTYCSRLEIDGAAAEIASGFRDRGAEAVLLGDDAHDVALRRHHDLDLLLHHLVVGIERAGVERIHDRDDQFAVAD